MDIIGKKPGKSSRKIQMLSGKETAEGAQVDYPTGKCLRSSKDGLIFKSQHLNRPLQQQI